ncbi:hypothetical protein LSTR_LSTR003712 [Laodelphax striatellus]|uniref:Regulatory protein zeste n=1 Tax=Laodelphax striatellus TaxID=195883 RepID=A0A482WZI0_LAOST|nr:hypothetical protein LSTR_LSTR003712 [Laodelphax striatellus]
MSSTKGRKQRVNFTREELKLVKQLVLERPIIVVNTAKDLKTENMRKSAWKDIETEFNARNLNIRRNVDQLKGSWKRIKKMYKAQKAIQRQSGSRGPPSPTTEEDEEDIEVHDMFEDEKPLLVHPDVIIPDIIDGSSVDYPGVVLSSSRSASPKLDPSISGSSSIAATYLETTLSVQPLEAPQKKISFAECYNKKKMEYLKLEHELKMKMLEEENYCSVSQEKLSFAEQFHNKRMEYLKLEHELKMKVLEEEKSYWALMKANAQQLFTLEEEKIRRKNLNGDVQDD